MDTKFAILGAGYYTNANADALMAGGVSFLMRMKPNPRAYKEVVRDHLATLERRENTVMHNGRFVYVKRVPCDIGTGGRRGWAYPCLDTAMRRELERDAARRAAEAGLGGTEAFDSMAAKGVFVLVSTRKISKEKLLPLYYTRDRVKKVFELAKQGGKALPVSVQTEETFRSHLLLCFMATAATKMMSDVLASAKTSLTLESMLEILHEQYGIIYGDEMVTTEPVRKMNEAYRAFGIKCPETISLPVVG
ncbi:MAG: hypothetical protein Q4A01_12605 [Coriobacteriales bacterium]|nr:hypothetical protein [Coriobacteriales bacterium]